MSLGDISLRTPTLGQFRRWLEQGLPGTAFAYFAGFLAKDRDRFFPDRYIRERPEALVLADEAWAAHEAGEVELVQAKVNTAEFVYLAVKRKRRRKT